MATLLLTLNLLVVLIFATAYYNQLKSIFYSKNLTGISFMFWYLVSFSTLFSLLNVLRTGNAEWYIYLGQFINAGVALIIVIWLNFKRIEKPIAVIFSLLYILLALVIFSHLSLEVSQTVATISIVLAYIDQIIHFIRKKTSEGANPLLYLFFAIGLSLLVTIFSLTGVSIHIIITEVANICLLLTCFVLAKVYSKKNKK